MIWTFFTRTLVLITTTCVKKHCTNYLFSDYAGFEQDVAITRVVPVIVGESVALKCDINSGSKPTPAIEWVINDGSDDMVLEEDTYSGTIRFVDDNEYVILEVKNDIIANQYFCRVTNKEGFQTERAPTTYTLNPG